ncbi:MAG TPA: glycosyltransferase [Candidatus Nanoarchaeia archaeon]|nr:glycosyltransferase [Candidatus Nanoarchaeia archaeon]
MVSIIIPACNEEMYLENTLKSIKNQNFKNHEIIVVCDGCTDNTEKIAKKYKTKIVNLKERTGPANAKNKGVEKADYNKLVFLDADTLLSEGILNNIDKILNSEKEIIGTCIIKPSNRKLKHKIAMSIKNTFFCPLGKSNGIIFCKKSTFEKFKGFNNSLKQAEDWDFVRRIKKQGKYIILKNPVISSTRRFEEKGYTYTTVYWIKQMLKPKLDKDYEIIR